MLEITNSGLWKTYEFASATLAKGKSSDYSFFDYSLES